MAPRGTPKPKSTPKSQRTVSKMKSSPVLKPKTVPANRTTDTAHLKDSNMKVNPRTRTLTATKDIKKTSDQRVRTRTEPKPATPKAKENRAAVPPGSVTKSGKKSAWKRRPQPAHSGIPLPEKMKKLMAKMLMEENNL